MKHYKILLVDDHPLICEAYSKAFNIFQLQNEGYNFLINQANNCEDAYEKIKSHYEKKIDLDIAFLDISLPPSKDNKIISGEDLGLKIKKLLPNCKIVISTTFNDNYRIHSILKSINPDGFLVKGDINPLELLNAVKTVIQTPPYYSRTILQLLRKKVSNENLLDETDRKILYELSLGTKTKDLPELIYLSIAAIEKRKRQMKYTLDVESDRDLILKAKKLGFI